jgi:hypothetical protein
VAEDDVTVGIDAWFGNFQPDDLVRSDRVVTDVYRV